jgi:hypothetical protein
VRDPGVARDVADPGAVVAVVREHPNGRVENPLALRPLGD